MYQRCSHKDFVISNLDANNFGAPRLNDFANSFRANDFDINNFG